MVRGSISSKIGDHIAKCLKEEGCKEPFAIDVSLRRKGLFTSSDDYRTSCGSNNTGMSSRYILCHELKFKFNNKMYVTSINVWSPMDNNAILRTLPDDWVSKKLSTLQKEGSV